MDTPSKTPLTDAAQKAFDEYAANPPANLWQCLKDGDNDTPREWVAKAPPQGWEFSRQLEAKLNHANDQITSLLNTMDLMVSDGDAQTTTLSRVEVEKLDCHCFIFAQYEMRHGKQCLRCQLLARFPKLPQRVVAKPPESC